jgi:single-stranded DNA-binding protein
MNRVEISGILTTVPESHDIGQPPYQSLRVDFTLAVPGVRYDRRTESTVVDEVFVRVQAWEDLAEQVLPYDKGSYVHVVGELTQQEVTDARGRKDRKTRIRAMVITKVRSAPTSRPVRPATDEDEPRF